MFRKLKTLKIYIDRFPISFSLSVFDILTYMFIILDVVKHEGIKVAASVKKILEKQSGNICKQIL